MAHRLAAEYPLLHWLLTDGRRVTDPKAFLGALAGQFLANGIDVGTLRPYRAAARR